MRGEKGKEKGERLEGRKKERKEKMKEKEKNVFKKVLSGCSILKREEGKRQTRKEGKQVEISPVKQKKKTKKTTFRFYPPNLGANEIIWYGSCYGIFMWGWGGR